MSVSALVKKVRRYQFGPGRAILFAMAVLATVVSIWRWIAGFQPTSSLSDDRSWGIWLTFDLLVGIAISSGAFITAATVYIFNLKRYHAIIRPAILTGFLGYFMAILALLVDLGQPWRIWHAVIYWNIHSPMFEVAWCVMLYTIVLFLEFSPVLFQGLGWKWPLKTVRKITVPLVITGIVLSTMHQTSLGSIYMLYSERTHPLWYSWLTPINFLVSAVSVGFAMLTIEGNFSSIVYKERFDTRLFTGLVRMIPYTLGLYLLLRISELVFFGKFAELMKGGWPMVMYLVEMLAGVVAPIILFSMKKIREHRRPMAWSAGLVLFGLVLNRFNTGLIFFDGTPYLPAWQEIAVSAGFIAAGIAAFDFIAQVFPLFEHETA